MTSESAEPSIAGYSDGSTARTRSRLTFGKSRIMPLWTHSQRPWRKGWQLVCFLSDCPEQLSLQRPRLSWGR